MTAATQIVEEAIECSKLRNDIVKLRDSEIGRCGKKVIDLLRSEAEGYVETESARSNPLWETWGQDIEGEAWRVHVEMD